MGKLIEKQSERKAVDSRAGSGMVSIAFGDFVLKYLPIACSRSMYLSAFLDRLDTHLLPPDRFGIPRLADDSYMDHYS